MERRQGETAEGESESRGREGGAEKTEAFGGLGTARTSAEDRTGQVEKRGPTSGVKMDEGPRARLPVERGRQPCRCSQRPVHGSPVPSAHR